MALLFSADELGDFLHCSVTVAAATSVERVVWGWLKPVLGLTERPDPVSEELFSWAIELGAIAHENPSGLSRYQLADEMQWYSAERRNQILDEAGSGGTPGGVPKPRGNFPTEECPSWPDPARARPRRWAYW
jgi:hypothetical protein